MYDTRLTRHTSSSRSDTMLDHLARSAKAALVRYALATLPTTAFITRYALLLIRKHGCCAEAVTANAKNEPPLKTSKTMLTVAQQPYSLLHDTLVHRLELTVARSSTRPHGVLVS